MKKFPSASATTKSRRAISGPALVVLALTLAAIWYGSRALSQTATESFDFKPTAKTADVQPVPDQPAVLPTASNPPAKTADPSIPAPAAPASTGQSGLPAGYPPAIPTPSNATLIKATVAGKEGDKNYIAAYQITAKPADAITNYQQQLKEAGFNVHATLSSADSGFFGAQKDALSMTVSVGVDQQATDKTNLTITTSGS